MNTKVKTTITISEDLLKELDEFANGECNRSEFVEKALQKHLDNLKLWQRVRENSAKETEILNRMAVEQREEIEDNHRFVAELMLESLNNK